MHQDCSGKKRKGNGEQAKQFAFDEIIQKGTEQGGGKKSENQIESETPPSWIKSEKAEENGQDLLAIKKSHGENGPSLNNDQVGIHRFLLILWRGKRFTCKYEVTG